MHYALTSVKGRGTVRDPFSAPTDAPHSLLDLRWDAANRHGGYVVVATVERDRGIRGVYLGDDAGEKSPTTLRALQDWLRTTLDADSLGEGLGELLLHGGRPGQPAALQPGLVVDPDGRRWRYEVVLGDDVVFEREVAAASGGLQYTDAFTRANAGTPGGSWQVLQGGATISSNRLRTTNDQQSILRLNLDLASNDHASQFDMVSDDAVFRTNLSLVRFSSSATTFYGTGYELYYGNREIHKQVNGATTILRTQAGPGQMLSSVIRSEVRGSTIKGLINGVEWGSVTDTSISAGRRTGLLFYQPNSQVTADNFLARDFQATFDGAGSATPTGRVRRDVPKYLKGTATGVGVSTLRRTVTRAFAGAVGGFGTVQRGILRRLSGSATAVGTIGLGDVVKRFYGASTGTARLVFRVRKDLAGSATGRGETDARFIGRIFGRPGRAVMAIRRAGEAVIRARRG